MYIKEVISGQVQVITGIFKKYGNHLAGTKQENITKKK